MWWFFMCRRLLSSCFRPPLYIYMYIFCYGQMVYVCGCVCGCVCVCVKLYWKYGAVVTPFVWSAVTSCHHAIIITVSALYRRMRRHSTWLQRARFRFRMPFGRAVSATVKSVSCDCSSYGSHLCSCKSSDDCTDYIAALPWFYRCCIALWLCLNRIALSQIMLLQVWLTISSCSVVKSDVVFCR
jgi:hypothetical protein